jgi:CRP/FNR family transcriptional regulator, cyclic AMP receptor protein
VRKALYLMGILNDTDVHWLAKKGIKSVFEAGSVVIRQGSPIQHLYIVLDGRLSVQVGNITIATLMAGEVIGEISFVDSRPPLASVIAEVPTIVLGIERSLLKKKLESDGHFGARFYHAIALFLADRLRSTTGRLGYKSATDEPDADLDDPDELDADFMQVVSMANVRFDFLIRSLDRH